MTRWTWETHLLLFKWENTYLTVSELQFTSSFLLVSWGESLPRLCLHHQPRLQTASFSVSSLSSRFVQNNLSSWSWEREREKTGTDERNPWPGEETCRRRNIIIISPWEWLNRHGLILQWKKSVPGTPGTASLRYSSLWTWNVVLLPLSFLSIFFLPSLNE